MSFTEKYLKNFKQIFLGYGFENMGDVFGSFIMSSVSGSCSACGVGMLGFMLGTAIAGPIGGAVLACVGFLGAVGVSAVTFYINLKIFLDLLFESPKPTEEEKSFSQRFGSFALGFILSVPRVLTVYGGVFSAGFVGAVIGGFLGSLAGPIGAIVGIIVGFSIPVCCAIPVTKAIINKLIEKPEQTPKISQEPATVATCDELSEKCEPPINQQLLTAEAKGTSAATANSEGIPSACASSSALAESTSSAELIARVEAGIAEVKTGIAEVNAGIARANAGIARANADIARNEAIIDAGFARSKATIDAGFARSKAIFDAGFTEIRNDLNQHLETQRFGVFAPQHRTDAAVDQAPSMPVLH